MNYRHIYHAGNRADIFKHVTLTRILKKLSEKEAPFCVMDTHAGIGLYDTKSTEAQKTKEADTGFAAFLQLPAHPLLHDLKDILQHYNPHARAQTYTGSPALIRRFLRSTDNFIAIEKHPDDIRVLKTFLRDCPQAHIHQRDAWEAMGALIPVPEKRLFVFIDPPFEDAQEFDKALTAITKAYNKASHAVFAFWYPIKDVVSVGKIQARFAASGMQKILKADVLFHKTPKPETMNGAGMLIINPPWQLEVELKAAYQALMPLCDKTAPAPTLDWLV